MRGLVLLSLFAPFLSCSLMSLDDFETAHCASDADCEAARLHERATCAPYECRAGLCVVADGVERCNGKDDDCDGFIDEHVAFLPGTDEAALEPREVPSLGSSFDAATGVTYVVVGGALAEGRAISATGAVGASSSLRYDSAGATAEASCPIARGPAVCTFSQLAVAAAENQLVHATINDLGCSHGELRIGLGKSAQAFTAWLGKSRDPVTEDACNIGFGVDVSGRCTGASRANRTGAQGPLGASHPAVAALDLRAGEDGALVAWLATSAAPEQSSGNCGESSRIAVEALGVFVPEGEPDAWLNGTDGGIPIVLGETSSRSTPAVVALQASRRFLVAFASETSSGRGVRLVSVRSANGRLEHDEVDFVEHLGAERVALAVGRGGPFGTDVGIAWTSGCGGEQSLSFAVIRAAGSAFSVSAVTTIQAPYATSMPQLAYAPSGFSESEPQGGWFLFWVQSPPEAPREFKVARIAEAGMTLLNEAILRRGAAGEPILIRGTNAEFRYATIEAGDGRPSRINSSVGWCHDID
jgi:hypothetical protein